MATPTPWGCYHLTLFAAQALLPALTEAKSLFWWSIKYSLFPPLLEAILAGESIAHKGSRANTWLKEAEFVLAVRSVLPRG